MEDKDRLMKLFREMEEAGLEAGEYIAKRVEELHPNALLIIPLYRSCLVVLPKEDPNRVDMVFYGDPHWRNRDITLENLEDERTEISIVGSRSYPRIYANGEDLR